MALAEHEALMVGSLEQLREEIRQLANALTAADELGAIVRIAPVSWNAGDLLEDDYRGTFKAVAIFNKGPGVMRVGFDARTAAQSDAQATYLLRPFDSVVLPYRGSSLFYGGAAAGAATIFYLRTTQPFEGASNAGTAGQAAATPLFADVTDRTARLLGQVSPAAAAVWDVSDRIARSLGRVSRGLADSLFGGAVIVAPGAGVQVAATPPGVAAGVYEIFVTCAIGAGAVAADLGNMKLLEGATIIVPALAAPAPGGASFGPFRRTNVGATAYAVQAVAAATAGVPYSATIEATRLE